MSYLANTAGNPNDLGYFATQAALVSAYPIAVPGAFAVVGFTDTIWVWDEDTMTWINSGQSAPIGPTGYTGYTGYTGAGTTGYTGYTGAGNFTGFTGYTGRTGFTGYTGAGAFTGYTGYTGTTGYTGYTGAGAFTGPIGPTGFTGPTGYTGAGAFTGYTGYTGYTGTTGYTGYTGAGAFTGYTGYTGTTGFTGYTGYTGPESVTPSNTVTLTNKRNQPRTNSTTTAATLAPDLGTANVYYRTTQTETLTISAPIGTPVIGETISIYVDSVAAQTLTINATYKAFGSAFPATTTAGKTFMLVAQFNGTDWKTTHSSAV